MFYNFSFNTLKWRSMSKNDLFKCKCDFWMLLAPFWQFVSHEQEIFSVQNRLMCHLSTSYLHSFPIYWCYMLCTCQIKANSKRHLDPSDFFFRGHQFIEKSLFDCELWARSLTMLFCQLMHNLWLLFYQLQLKSELISIFFYNDIYFTRINFGV